MNDLLVAAPVCLLSMVILGYVLGRWRRVADLQALSDISKDLPTLILDYETQRRRAVEYLAKIEEVIAEREQWRALYNDQAGGHENAQALMLQTITHLAQRYEMETGKAPKIDPLIDQVRGEWMSVHGTPAREKLGDNGRPEEDQKEKPA